MSIEIKRLAEARNTLPELAALFEAEWSEWYGAAGNGDAHADLEACCNGSSLPIGLVALGEQGQVLGTASLKQASLGSEFGHTPWLAAMVVMPAHRGKGIGDALVGAIESAARELGYGALYTTTDKAERLILRRGWVPTGEVATSQRGRIKVYRITL
ncbi:GNAT family N-acetyltransferase [Pseudovibrio sp. SPO723]|uniref:GNAT family N-acetyltransferase n=1 Tax=Nesiotobacter zosterae TaxID=392721 RepID=UPI0029C3B274|nr:GNAT family N-acetyltransferase [Pseudovibrio sp. SPO723]MDX5592869.1 GNAT family N-acetyltransferase [Pseudovibrio sp. SPO723]